jgi:Leucine-rich repeat (LRR) protein
MNLSVITLNKDNLNLNLNFNYSNLHTIKINNCNLQSLHFLQSCFYLFNQLNNLDISNNLLTHIPKNLHLCKSLNYINFSNNHIYYIPDDFNKIKSLTNLDISNNQITYINNIPNQLNILDISFNSLKLEEITIDLENFYNLKKLNLNGCIYIKNLYLLNNCLEEIYIMETLIDNIYFNLNSLDNYKNLKIFVYKYTSKVKNLSIYDKLKQDLDTIYKYNITTNSNLDNKYKYKYIVE